MNHQAINNLQFLFYSEERDQRHTNTTDRFPIANERLISELLRPISHRPDKTRKNFVRQAETPQGQEG